MVDYRNIAIADLLRHPIHGLVSHQPGFGIKISNKIMVRTEKGILLEVLASECSKDISSEEWAGYWKEFPKEI